MLKYGELSVINNLNSKSLVPRNLIYRQKELFKTAVSPDDINGVLNASTFSIPNASSVTAGVGDFLTSNSSTIFVNLIKKKTFSVENITINNSLLVTDLTNTTSQTFSYLFAQQSNFQSTRLDMDIGNLTLRDNVIEINSKFFNDFSDNNFIEKTFYDRILSGFIFPNTNDDPNKKKFNSMLVIPNKYYLDTQIDTPIFKKYDSGKIDCFGSAPTEYTNSIRFILTNYDFSKNSTYLGTDNKLNSDDSDLTDINNCNNLLNIEAKNIALHGGKIIAIGTKSFNPSNFLNETDPSIQFLIYKNHTTPSLIGTMTDTLFNLKKPIKIQDNIQINTNGIQFGLDGTTNLFDIKHGTGSGTTKNFINLDANLNKMTVNKYLLLENQLDLSANGNIIFGKNNINFIKDGTTYISVNDTTIDIIPNIKIFNDNPAIQIPSLESFAFTDFSNNILWKLNNVLVDTSASYTFLQPNPSISFQNGTSLNFIQGVGTVCLKINSTMLTTNGDLQFTNSSPEILINPDTDFSIIDTSNNNIITFNTTSVHINTNNFLFDSSSSNIFFNTSLTLNNTNNTPILTLFDDSINCLVSAKFDDISCNNITTYTIKTNDISCNQLIFDGTNPQITITSGQILNVVQDNNSFLSISQDEIDCSANIQLLNSKPEIKFTDNLNLTSLSNQLTDIYPLITYNTQNCSELKYLANIQINSLNVYSNVFFKNILSDDTQNNTFSGKIISKDGSGSIMSMTFQGYSSFDQSINRVTYFVNQMISPNIDWNIVDMEIINFVDLQITLSNPQLTNTNWNISLESISI